MFSPTLTIIILEEMAGISFWKTQRFSYSYSKRKRSMGKKVKMRRRKKKKENLGFLAIELAPKIVIIVIISEQVITFQHLHRNR